REQTSMLDLAQAIHFHLKIPGLWIYAATWEFDQNPNDLAHSNELKLELLGLHWFARLLLSNLNSFSNSNIKDAISSKLLPYYVRFLNASCAHMGCFMIRLKL
ncbi:hypothetical protein ACJX0J_017357, partial [Zea mays]